ncbi:hypothetical protein [Dactylosporangium darangshiense]|uniref:Lipoprotein n=1 Tax=Dactylosporangium darangshiense TaxID=579108 RepID=A0ABP8DES1_9ACTN
MVRRLLIVSVIALTLGACRPGTDDPPAPGPLSSPTTAAVAGPVAFHVNLGAGQTLDTRPVPPGGCPGLDARVDLGRGVDVRFAAYGSACDAGDNARPGNGRHGVFRTTADIPPERRAGATTVHTALGEATVFTQPYYECTNSCHNYTEAVALITLDRPADPAYRTLTAYAEKGEASQDRLTELLRNQLTA